MSSAPLVPRPCPMTGGQYCRIVSPKVGSPVSGLVYSSRPIGFSTHWIGGRTHPCLGTGPECIGHVEGIPVRWKGYLFGRSEQTHAPCLFEIPADTYRHNLQLRDDAVCLRGAAIRLIRVGPNVNSPVSCNLRLDAKPDACPSEEPDIVAWLCVVWGVANPFEDLLSREGGRLG